MLIVEFVSVWYLRNRSRSNGGNSHAERAVEAVAPRAADTPIMGKGEKSDTTGLKRWGRPDVRGVPETVILGIDAVMVVSRNLLDPAEKRLKRAALLAGARPERDDFSSNRHPALSFLLSMIFFGKPVSTLPDHALTACDCLQPIEIERPALAMNRHRHFGKATMTQAQQRAAILWLKLDLDQ